jgi:hypothetical protein
MKYATKGSRDLKALINTSLGILIEHELSLKMTFTGTTTKRGRPADADDDGKKFPFFDKKNIILVLQSTFNLYF